MTLPQPSRSSNTTRLAQLPQSQPVRAMGIAALDNLLDGGLEPGVTWMVSGRPGSGKSLLAAHFIAEGIMREEPGIYITAAESPATLLRYFARYWPMLESAVSHQQLSVLDPAPFFTELRLTAQQYKSKHSAWDDLWRFVQDVITQSRNQNAKRIIIDPVTPLLFAHDGAIELWDITQTLINTLNQNLGATTLLTHIAGPDPRSQEMTNILESLCAGVLHVERGNDQLGRPSLSIEIFKHRYHAQSRCTLSCPLGPGGHLESTQPQEERRIA